MELFFAITLTIFTDHKNFIRIDMAGVILQFHFKIGPVKSNLK